MLNNRITETLALLFAIGVAISRIYLGQHFAADLAMGAFLGVLIALLSYGLFFIKWGNIKWMNWGIYRSLIK